jgi:hypothetical protein
MNTNENTAGAELVNFTLDFLNFKMADGCTLEQAGNHLREHLRQMAAEREAWTELTAGWNAD